MSLLEYPILTFPLLPVVSTVYTPIGFSLPCILYFLYCWVNLNPTFISCGYHVDDTYNCAHPTVSLLYHHSSASKQ